MKNQDKNQEENQDLRIKIENQDKELGPKKSGKKKNRDVESRKILTSTRGNAQRTNKSTDTTYGREVRTRKFHTQNFKN